MRLSVKLSTKRNERFLQGRRRTPVIRVRTDHRRSELGDARSADFCGAQHPFSVRHAPIWGNTPAWPLTGFEIDRRFRRISLPISQFDRDDV